jgi:hypothetical protein
MRTLRHVDSGLGEPYRGMLKALRFKLLWTAALSRILASASRLVTSQSGAELDLRFRREMQRGQIADLELVFVGWQSSAVTALLHQREWRRSRDRQPLIISKESGGVVASGFEVGFSAPGGVDG